MKILIFILTIVISFIIQIVDAKPNWYTCESQNGFCVAPLKCRLPGQRAIRGICPLHEHAYEDV